MKDDGAYSAPELIGKIQEVPGVDVEPCVERRIDIAIRTELQGPGHERGLEPQAPAASRSYLWQATIIAFPAPMPR
ncbi:hypothetical protein [Pseudomonas piscis]|uniref:hypothetical protein n=1 Tax=Pseudomonas piscis TaxID=2614538 RepID=UPI0003B44251|nr:hypothetical protein [Pseudomonas piscis]ERO65698.1 hypothetical protein P308_18240 [Pseudomonas piscis]